MIRKDVILAVLATFCLTATLFLVIPTRSTEGVPTTGYDPFADVSSPLLAGYPDNKIDTADVAFVAHAFGTEGISTRNITVLNWPDSTGSGNVTIANLPLDDRGNVKISMQENAVHGIFTYKEVIFSMDPVFVESSNAFTDGVWLAASNYTFCFNPTATPFNVTAVYIMLMGIQKISPYDGSYIHYTITVNDQTESRDLGVYISCRLPTVFSISCPTLTNAIRQGLNSLKIVCNVWVGSVSGWREVDAFQATVFIEYQC